METVSEGWSLTCTKKMTQLDCPTNVGSCCVETSFRYLNILSLQFPVIIINNKTNIICSIYINLLQIICILIKIVNNFNFIY